ncbi:MAG: patatin-like phospholipase family protein [Thermoanaerobaculia bacterium]|nr:patatin-like phospholipase family protein [Thermoanaerobaculia bacterium]
MPEPPLLQYRAGRSARRRLLERGLVPEAVGAVVGPASGPKWLALVGLDHALLESGLLLGDSGSGRRRLLVGASAGAWRMAAMSSPDPLRTHRRLVEGYVGKVFPKKVTASMVTDAYVPMLSELFPAQDVKRTLGHPNVDLAAHAVRVRKRLPVRPRPLLAAWLAGAAAANLVSPRALGAFVERVLFHSAPDRFTGEVRGRVEPLTDTAFRQVLLASASVPMALEAVDTPRGAPQGQYLDGGVTDYHLATRYLVADDDRIVLLPHYRERIAPGWFDKHLRRSAPPGLLRNVLQIFPDPSWVASLPGGRVPDRRDFYELVDVPEARLARWNEVVALSERLGQALLSDLQSGTWADRLEPLT